MVHRAINFTLRIKEYILFGLINSIFKNVFTYLDKRNLRLPIRVKHIPWPKILKQIRFQCVGEELIFQVLRSDWMVMCGIGNRRAAFMFVRSVVEVLDWI